jgi:hypothetical protein
MSKVFKRDPENGECEKAYRRGYANGVRAMMLALGEKLSEDERENFEAWFADVLMPWCQGSGPSHPPEPPRWW